MPKEVEGKVRKNFFFEKKKQKAFATLAPPLAAGLRASAQQSRRPQHDKIHRLHRAVAPILK
jgi:hypothetical protein